MFCNQSRECRFRSTFAAGRELLQQLLIGQSSDCAPVE